MSATTASPSWPTNSVCLLRQAALELDGIIWPAFAGPPFGFIGHSGSHYLFGGNYFDFLEYCRLHGSKATLTKNRGWPRDMGNGNSEAARKWSPILPKILLVKKRFVAI